jgi:hypothetical protein
MDNLGLAAAVMTIRRTGDDSRYDGWVGLSALPSAPVVDERPSRRRAWRSLGRLSASVRVPKRRVSAAASASRPVLTCPCADPAGLST